MCSATWLTRPHAEDVRLAGNPMGGAGSTPKVPLSSGRTSRRSFETSLLAAACSETCSLDAPRLLQELLVEISLTLYALIN